ncbi:MAG TPA: nucleotide disphospho-sugar-binding domain-containing protein [Pseudonocardiaceae bacterium]
MRVLFTPWPTPAHLYPIVPLAWALQTAGHEVRIATHASIAGAIASSGLAAVPLGDPEHTPLGPGVPWQPEIEQKMERITEALGLEYPDRDHWDVLYKFMLPSMWDWFPYGASPSDPHRELDELVEFARYWQPDLVIWDPVCPIGAVAAKVTGAAHGRHLWGIDYFAWAMDRFAERAERPGQQPEENPLVETMRPACERYGVELDDELITGQFTIDPLPAAMRLPTATRTVPMRWEPYSAQTPLAPWLLRAPSRPRVGMSLGLSQRLFFADGWDQVPRLMEMVADLDIEVVATLDANQLSQVAALPDNVRTVDFVALNQLLPTCSVLIHQGGMGTFAAAAALGVPQLILDHDVENGWTVVETEDGEEGLATEKHTESTATATYVTERGAGLPLDIRQAVDVMRKNLVRLLEERSFRDGAAEVRADTLSAPTPNEVVSVLERLTTQHRSRT